MELGLIKYRRQGTNLLQEAVHDKNGVVWSDGQGIFLAPVSLNEGQVEQQEPTKLGEFDRGVRSIHWSEDIFDGFCYMCVVHDRNISIWKVEGHSPKLSFKQVRKVNIQPIQQGCLWCPERDILCVLCQHQASLYYSHVQNKGSLVLHQLDSREKIHCGCWLPDGSKLVICSGTSLAVYRWPDIDDSVLQYSNVSWTIPGLDAPISSLESLTNDSVICSMELPLESLCKQNDTFILPDLLNTQSTVQELSHVSDSDIIKPRQTTVSLKDTLLNLPRNSEADIEDSSCLVIVSIADELDLETVTRTKVKGILTPDILLFEPESQQVIVSSNTQALLQLFELDDGELRKSGEICLEKDERPKGICCIPRSLGQVHAGLLLLLGKKEPSDSAFLASSNYTTMKSVLKVFSIKRAGKNGEDRKKLTYTNSVPLTENDRSNVHHSVQYGSLNVFKNSGEIDIGQGQVNGKVSSANNNLSKGYVSDNFANLKTAHTKSCFDLSATKKISNNSKKEEIPKNLEVVKCKSVGNVNHETEKLVVERSSPPKRPVRKKKSSRGKTDMPAKPIEKYKQTLNKMAMEYSSSSPDISPRLSGTSAQNTTQQNYSEVKQCGIHEQTDSLQSYNSAKARMDICEENKTMADKNAPNEMLDSSNSSEVSDISKHSTSSKCDSYTEESTRSITLFPGRKETSNQSKITVLGIEDNEKELEIERVDFDSHKRNFEKPNLKSPCFLDPPNALVLEENNLAKTNLDEIKTDKNDDRSTQSKLHDSERKVKIQDSKNETSLSTSRSLESLEDIDQLLKEQTKNIANLQEQVSDLNRRINESSCVLPTRYQDNQNPEMVYVSFLCKDGSEIKKRFLLDSGRLKLEPVKQTFSLETVEIYIDDEPCVTGSNIDGYIPMRFQSGSTIHITGKPSLRLV